MLVWKLAHIQSNRDLIRMLISMTIGEFRNGWTISPENCWMSRRRHLADRMMDIRRRISDVRHPMLDVQCRTFGCKTSTPKLDLKAKKSCPEQVFCALVIQRVGRRTSNVGRPKSNDGCPTLDVRRPRSYFRGPTSDPLGGISSSSNGGCWIQPNLNSTIVHLH
jgi:hypothetical protein